MALRKILMLRRPRSGRLEARTMSIQRHGDFFTASQAGIHGAAAWGSTAKGHIHRATQAWTPAFAGVTRKEEDMSRNSQQHHKQ